MFLFSFVAGLCFPFCKATPCRAAFIRLKSYGWVRVYLRPSRRSAHTWDTVLKFNLIYYAVTILVGVVLLVIMLLQYNISSWNALLAVCIALGNAWGMFLLIVFMGYGLVEVPRSFWWRANRDIVQNYYRYAVCRE